ncbi:DUF4174 domain-containing protein [Spirosoma sordidisoli]|uniref:DUF4174 domain-containing protein n=2 Tax=Cytophagaceae TaxID=89373 RepID=A0A4Q2UHT1_9BACT|nr:DUF4174 domain-containing protein [Spirosoma sordidisoli]
MQNRWLVSLTALLIVLTLVMESVANQRKSLKAILNEKKDHRRVLLLYGRDASSGSPGQHYLIDQQEALHEHKEAMAERDLDVIVLIASDLQEPDRQFLMQSEFKLVPHEDYMGWLIGKDGGIKQTYKKPVPAEELFNLIDSMPMRRQEAKKP